MMATIHDTLATDARWFLHRIEPVQRQALFVRVERDELRQSTFLDERLLLGNREGGWLALDSLPEIPKASATGRYIFHIGHCGSTLISRLLDHWPGVLGLREPLAMRTLAELEENADSPLARFEPRDLPALRQTVTALLERPFVSGQNTIIKATSSCNCLIRPLLAEQPATRIVLLSMPLESYLASVLKSADARRDALNFAPDRLSSLHRRIGMDQPRLHQLTDAQIIAMGWLAEQARFADIDDPFRVLRVDFEIFLANPAQELHRVVQFFDLAVDPEIAESALLAPTLREYSKATNHGYSAGDRAHDLALSRQRFGEEIRFGMRYVESLVRLHPSLSVQE